jgi:hypothetical protein
VRALQNPRLQEAALAGVGAGISWVLPGPIGSVIGAAAPSLVTAWTEMRSSRRTSEEREQLRVASQIARRGFGSYDDGAEILGVLQAVVLQWSSDGRALVEVPKGFAPLGRGHSLALGGDSLGEEWTT